MSWHQVLFGPGLMPSDAWLALFGHFLALSLLTVGGAITTLPDMHRYIVAQQHWLTDAQFTASVALAQGAPGPNVLFVAVIGFNVGGLAGVAATMLGTLLPSTALALVATHWQARNPQARVLHAFTTGMAPLTIGLLLATGWILLEPTRGEWTAAALVAATIWLMLRTRLSPLLPIAVGGAAGLMGWV